ncbi:MAG: PAS domain S-box protein, partial [Telluria sp.]
METHSQPEGFEPACMLRKQQLLERQLNDVQSIAHVGTWEFLAASNKLIWSDEACRIMGIAPGSFDGNIDTYISLIHPDDRAKVLASIEQSRREPDHPVLEHRVLWPDGEVRQLLVRGHPFADAEGNPSISGTLQDITGLKQSSARLRAISRKLLNTLESMTDAFYTLDRGWRFTYLNAEAERLLQQPRAELLGKDLWDEFPNLRGTRFEIELRQAMEQNRPSAFEEYYMPLNFWRELRIFPSTEGLAVYFTDISERKRLQEIERRNEERFKLVANTTSDVIWDWDVAADRIWWSEGIQRVFGYSPDEFDDGIGAWARRIHPDERSGVLDGLYTAKGTLQENWRDEYRFMRKNGSYVDVRDRGTFIRNSDGVAVRLIGAMVDITEQKQAEADRQRAEARNRVQASLLDKAQDAISVTGIDARLTYWNKGAQRLYGWTADEAVGKNKAELLIVDLDQFHSAYQATLQQGEWTGELLKRHKDGHTFPVESHLTLMRNDDGHPQSVLAIETDITQRKEAEREIEDLAFFDPLTGLPNRRLLLDRLRHALATCRRTGHTGALLFLDLDNFKSLNDTLGHDKGDLLLQQVARRLRTRVPRDSDTVARHGGDEFIIVLEDLSGQQAESAGQAELVAEKIQAAFVLPFQLNEYQHHTTPSIGVALFDKHMSNVDELLKRADLAMYQAKAAGRNAIRFFDPEM